MLAEDFQNSEPVVKLRLTESRDSFVGVFVNRPASGEDFTNTQQEGLQNADQRRQHRGHPTG